MLDDFHMAKKKYIYIYIFKIYPTFIYQLYYLSTNIFLKIYILQIFNIFL